VLPRAAAVWRPPLTAALWVACELARARVITGEPWMLLDYAHALRGLKSPAHAVYALRGLGTDEALVDLASYLLFDGVFCRRLIELGSADVAAARGQIESFFGHAPQRIASATGARGSVTSPFLPEKEPRSAQGRAWQPVEKGGQSLSTVRMCSGISAAERGLSPFSNGLLALQRSECEC